MSFEERTISVLQSLGLTYYGAKAYHTLVALGPSGASTLAEESQIPRSKIYGVLRRLVREGWVITANTRPLQYRARDPREVMGARLENFQTEVNLASAELASMFDGIVERESPNAWMIRGEENIARRVSDMVRRAREEILFLGALYLPSEMDALASQIPLARDKGVEIKVLVRDHMATEGGEVILAERLRELTPDVRVMRTPSIKFIIADHREILLMFSLVVGDVADLSNVAAIWMPRSEIATLMRSNFLMMWDVQEPRL